MPFGYAKQGYFGVLLDGGQAKNASSKKNEKIKADRFTLPQTNSQFAPENRPFAPKGKDHLNQPSIFRCKLAVSFREGMAEDSKGRIRFKSRFLGGQNQDDEIPLY